MSYTASKLIAVAEAEVGYLEKETNRNLDSKTGNAGDENFTKYARDLHAAGYYQANKNGYEWCEVFNDWCHWIASGKDAKLAQEVICQTGVYGAGCIWSARCYRNAGRFFTTPMVGDQIYFGKKGEEHHTGIVYKVDKTHVYTIEGNTSGASGVIANGGGVCKKSYLLTDSKIVGYGRPRYAAEATAKVYKPSVKEWQIAAIADGYKFPKYGADGVWGTECESVAKKAVVKKRIFYTNKSLTRIVQKVVGFTGDNVDGKCGSLTDKAIRAYQRKHGLTDDGAVGLNTWKKILGV